MNRDDLLYLHERVERQLTALLEDFPADRWCYQPFANANHALWTIGHLGVVARSIGVLLRGEPPVKDRMNELFGKGSTVQAEASAYPPVAEVQAFSAEMRQALIAAIRTVPEARFAEPTPQVLHFIAPVWGRVVAAMAAHASFHLGQFAVIRKALNLSPRIG